MKKVNLGKSTVVMSDNVNRKNLYVDTKHADSINKDMVKLLSDINKTYDKLNDILNKMSYKKMFTGEYNSVAVQCSKKCAIQRDNADKLREDIVFKYNDDVKFILIKNLDERISYLESKFLSNK